VRASTAPLAVPDGPRQAPPRVLVCDESAALRSMMRRLLSPQYELCLTASGEEALERSPAFAPDVVISDLVLPGMSGSVLCRRLRADPATRDVPVVLVTSLADADARAEGLESGANDYIAKPIRARELQARVGSLVRLRRTMLALEERSEALERSNAALREAQHALLRAERFSAVGTLAAGLAHEIANPLSCIKAGSSAIMRFLREVGDGISALADGSGREPADRHGLMSALAESMAIAGELADGSRRIERIAADLRVFAGPAMAVDEAVDLADAVDGAWTVARSRFAALPRLTLEARACAPIRASGALVRQALIAVFENAVLAAGPGGLVRVTLRDIPDGAEIEVQDSGPGIPREILPRIFDPFFTTRPVGAGTGLGLAVAYGIVSGLGGDIGVDSPPGEGARFRVRLPRAPGAFARGA
jgi:two-component system, NtrC family, sensor kinase